MNYEFVKCSYSLRNELTLNKRKIHSVTYGVETASLMELVCGTNRFWSSLPSNIKECNSLELFKSKIKT